ncbi:undecaprenyl-phosphate glucose phosphotransferase [Synechococcales cyanobacterium C]|uniref:Undecaprenyl-phosphate glucose phosphotransferase n=1 Tax=Petrachloros mirabilis ULC683 TaxID=2781853 RepID=A0A8K2A2I2_9CYAN|nr:undecaprenyl-phosphate glucose phosphotransferase [Petrachloros mirabilis]NCJ08362.1 undecaprenyl-phosphate glucose phosphotransferase [Petrachloros mirabilis ULC683]
MPYKNSGILRENASAILIAQRLLDPAIAALLLLGLHHFWGTGAQTPYLLLATTTFLLMLPILKAMGIYCPYRSHSPGTLATRLLTAWVVVLGSLLFLGFLSQTSAVFSRGLLLTWSFCVPVVLLCFHLTIWKLLRRLRANGRNSRTAVIAGLGHTGYQLATQLQNHSELGIRLHGFFDDIIPEGQGQEEIIFLGSLTQLPIYVKQHHIDVVYITCSMENEEVITSLIHSLQDTTACVYYVPNLLTFNLMSARSYELNGLPLIAIWEVPFSEIQYILKRTTDIAIAGLALGVLSPVFLGIAIAVKLSSPGPVLFKQRRYGLNGQEIIVYKFRSMRVMEDGDAVPQAKRDDSRITPLGGLLRKSSFDELPQFVNVLQGRMSIVGPRPHAVAHNEMYRKMISGYMLRHKVKPGITGWAQVNGLRGETDTLEKMQQRVNYDLEYLRNWSFSFDLQIILKTALVFLHDQNAY